jgi:nicotinamidase-related amidase
MTHGCVRATSLGALTLGFDVVLVADGHSSYSRDAAQQIEKWNRQLAEAGARLAPAVQVDL